MSETKQERKAYEKGWIEGRNELIKIMAENYEKLLNPPPILCQGLQKCPILEKIKSGGD